MDCPSAVGRLVVRKGTTRILHIASRIRLGSSLGRGAPSEQLFDSEDGGVSWLSVQQPRTYQNQSTIIHKLVKPTFRAIVLNRQPCLNQGCAVIALHEVVFKPRQRYPNVVSSTREVRDCLTIIKPITDDKVPIRMAHLHMFLEVPQLVDALLRERHEQHVHSDTCNGIVFRFYVSVFPPSRVLLCLALAFDELGRIG